MCTDTNDVVSILLLNAFVQFHLLLYTFDIELLLFSVVIRANQDSWNKNLCSVNLVKNATIVDKLEPITSN